MRVVEPLTDKKIRAAKAGDKPLMLFDGGGLYLEITPAGSKLWRLKYRHAGKDNRMSLGRYPDMSLKDARESRGALRKLIDAGLDPLAERKRVIAEATATEAELRNTFEYVAREWHEKVKSQWSEGHQKRILSRLEKQLFPYIGNMHISQLETTDYLAAIQKAEARGVIETAHRLAQLCGQVVRYAINAGIIKYDAASTLKGALSHAQTKHYAAITEPAEFGRLLGDIDAYQGEPAICHALRILPYVFVRSRELRGAAWNEIDFDAGQWVIPAARMKMRRPHIVPLAPQVVRLFQSMRDYSSNSALVFPSVQSANRCISDMGLLNALRRMGYGKDKMTIHGFRSSASTMLNGQGYNRDWIEAQLAHAEKNAIRDAYNRADYLPERCRMMIEWANYIDGLRQGAVARQE